MTKLVKYVQKQFELPAEGVQRGRLVEVEELDPAMNADGVEKERVRFIWELDQTDSSGDPMRVFESFNRTLHPQSFLCRAVTEIVGHDVGNEFDLDTLVGAEIDLVLKHNRAENGRTYANVAVHLRPKTKAEAAEERRVSAAIQKVKQAATSPPTAAAPVANAEIMDDDIPF